MVLKKLHWTLKRHPFLYLTRFRLLSRNSNIDDISGISYNACNTKAEIPEYFNTINTAVFKNGKPAGTLAQALVLSTWLNTHIKGGPGLSEASEAALKLMLAGDGGVCSDMTQVFNNFCVINDIPVREWGTTSAPFNRANGGHSFNEVYCDRLNKWVLLDVSWGMMCRDDMGQLLSVIELYDLQRKGELVHYETVIEGKVIDKSVLNKNYKHASITPFLICGYRTKIYDEALTFTRPVVPVFITHFFIYLMRRSYYYRFPLDDYHKIFSRT